jgi:ankyrin repeat protein
MECVAAGDVFLARALLKLQVSQVNGVSARSSPKLSPLHCAVVNNQMECVRLLVEEFGAKLTIFDMEGVSPGHAAARIPGCVMLKYFLENGYPPTSRDHRGQTLLHVAARYGNSECVDFILFRLNCIAFDVRDCWQRTAVHWAIVNNHRNVLTVMQRYLEDVQQGRPPPSCAPGSANRVLPARQIGRKERFVRLAAKRSHLIYETPMELCRRLYPANDPIFSICESFTHML